MFLNLRSQITDCERYNIYLLPSNERHLTEVIDAVQSEEIPVVDIGRTLSESLIKRKSTKYLHLEAEEQFKRLIEQNAKLLDASKPPVIAIYNLGILLEPALSINADTLIKELSKTLAVVIIWEAEIDSSDILHWGEQKELYHLDFSDIHLKYLNTAYEI